MDQQNRYYLLDRLFSFLQRSDKEDLNPVLAGYFSKFVLMIIRQRPHQIVPYLYDSDTDVFDRLLDHMYNTSICEVIIKILVSLTPRYDKELNHVIYDKDFAIFDRIISMMKAGTRVDTLLNINDVICKELLGLKSFRAHMIDRKILK